MWIVVMDYGMETSVNSFYTEKEAMDYFEEWKELTDAEIYLAKVNKTFNVSSNDM